MTRRWQVLAVAFTIGACELVDPVPVGQQYLFDVSYVNFAWGLRWVGLVVEANGDVVAYERDQPWTPAQWDSFTQGELEQRYATNRRVVGHVSRDDLVRRMARLDRVGSDYTSPEFTCADAGTVTYQGYEYDEQAGSYTPVVVRQEGDSARQNRSQAGHEIAGWLMNLAVDSEIQELTGFQTSGSCTP